MTDNITRNEALQERLSGEQSSERCLTWASETASGSWTPKVILYMMDSAKRIGSWLTMET